MPFKSDQQRKAAFARMSHSGGSSLISASPISKKKEKDDEEIEEDEDQDEDED